MPLADSFYSRFSGSFLPSSLPVLPKLGTIISGLKQQVWGSRRSELTYFTPEIEASIKRDKFIYGERVWSTPFSQFQQELQEESLRLFLDAKAGKIGNLDLEEETLRFDLVATCIVRERWVSEGIWDPKWNEEQHKFLDQGGWHINDYRGLVGEPEGVIYGSPTPSAGSVPPNSADWRTRNQGDTRFRSSVWAASRPYRRFDYAVVRAAYGLQEISQAESDAKQQSDFDTKPSLDMVEKAKMLVKQIFVARGCWDPSWNDYPGPEWPCELSPEKFVENMMTLSEDGCSLWPAAHTRYRPPYLYTEEELGLFEAVRPRKRTKLYEDASWSRPAAPTKGYFSSHSYRGRSLWQAYKTVVRTRGELEMTYIRDRHQVCFPNAPRIDSGPFNRDASGYASASDNGDERSDDDGDQSDTESTTSEVVVSNGNPDPYEREPASNASERDSDDEGSDDGGDQSDTESATSETVVSSSNPVPSPRASVQPASAPETLHGKSSTKIDASPSDRGSDTSESSDESDGSSSNDASSSGSPEPLKRRLLAESASNTSVCQKRPWDIAFVASEAESKLLPPRPMKRTKWQHVEDHSEHQFGIIPTEAARTAENDESDKSSSSEERSCDSPEPPKCLTSTESASNTSLCSKRSWDIAFAASEVESMVLPPYTIKRTKWQHVEDDSEHHFNIIPIEASGATTSDVPDVVSTNERSACDTLALFANPDKPVVLEAPMDTNLQEPHPARMPVVEDVVEDSEDLMDLDEMEAFWEAIGGQTKDNSEDVVMSDDAPGINDSHSSTQGIETPEFVAAQANEHFGSQDTPNLVPAPDPQSSQHDAPHAEVPTRPEIDGMLIIEPQEQVPLLVDTDIPKTVRKRKTRVKGAAPTRIQPKRKCNDPDRLAAEERPIQPTKAVRPKGKGAAKKRGHSQVTTMLAEVT